MVQLKIVDFLSTADVREWFETAVKTVNWFGTSMDATDWFRAKIVSQDQFSPTLQAVKV